MSHPNKKAGTRFESAVRDYLNSRGFRVIRQAQGGSKDQGDIFGIPNWALELKAEARIDLAGYIKEAEVEAENAGVDNYAAIVKKRKSGVADAYVVMPLHQFVRLIHAIHGTEEGAA